MLLNSRLDLVWYGCKPRIDTEIRVDTELRVTIELPNTTYKVPNTNISLQVKLIFGLVMVIYIT